MLIETAGIDIDNASKYKLRIAGFKSRIIHSSTCAALTW